MNPTPKGKFEKGNAGGPGRPSLKDEFRSRCRQATIDKCLPMWLSEVETNGKDAIRASQLLAEYGFGKPHQQVALTGEDGGPIGIESTVRIYLPDNGRDKTA